MVHNRSADGDLLQTIGASAPANRLRLKLAGVVIAQHDAATIRLDGIEDQVHDLLEQLIEIEDMADGLDRLVHDAEVRQTRLEPGALGLLGLRENAAAFRLANRLDDRG